jgi:Brp/Blh family beta-carotene 15,15'-monooxygenase
MTSLKRSLITFGLLITLVNSLIVISPQTQLYFFFITIFLTGIPHGALDYFVASQTQLQAGSKLALSKFLLRYLVNILAYSIIWIFFPVAALVIFIVLTAFHFGEVDWPTRQNTKLDALLYTIFGLQILVFIVVSHAAAALPIIVQILKLPIDNASILEQANTIFNISITSLAASILFIIVFFKKMGWTKQIMISFIIQTVLLLAIIYFLPLYLAFGFYFGIWHSLLSFNLIRTHLLLPNTVKGWLQMARKALPYALAAWVGIGILIIASNKFQKDIIASNLAIIFVAIAVLTLPHLQVFTKLKHK